MMGQSVWGVSVGIIPWMGPGDTLGWAALGPFDGTRGDPGGLGDGDGEHWVLLRNKSCPRGEGGIHGPLWLSGQSEQKASVHI